MESLNKKKVSRIRIMDEISIYPEKGCSLEYRYEFYGDHAESWIVEIKDDKITRMWHTTSIDEINFLEE